MDLGDGRSGGERIEARTIVWAAGVVASPAARWLGAGKDRADRVEVAADLSVPGRPEVFVIGDTALVNGPDGRPVPGIAPAAKQMGSYAATVIDRQARGLEPPQPFRYHHQGDLATIGRRSTVVVLRGVKLSGTLAWLLWAVAHVYFLIGWRSRLLVAINWLWNYMTFERGARLITAPAAEAPTDDLPVVEAPAAEVSAPDPARRAS